MKISELFPYLSESWCEIIQKQPKDLLKNATELRFRAGKPCSISCGISNYSIKEIVADRNDLDELLERICRGAMYRFEAQMQCGYVPLPGGHRAGICGSYVVDHHGEIRIINVSSINLRICRSVAGGAEE